MRHIFKKSEPCAGPFLLFRIVGREMGGKSHSFLLMELVVALGLLLYLMLILLPLQRLVFKLENESQKRLIALHERIIKKERNFVKGI